MAHGGLAPFPRKKGGSKPAAAAFLDQIKEKLGSAYTDENQSMVGARNIALSRAFACSWYMAEKVRNLGLPHTSTDTLNLWAKRLGVSVRAEDSPETIRNACIAKYKLPQGATRQNISDSLSILLGSALIAITEFKGSFLEGNHVDTFWAGNPGPSYLALDSEGAFVSTRCHIVISVNQPPNVSLDLLLYLLNVQMFALLDILLPAYCTWAWNFGAYGTGGFILAEDPNQSRLGYNVL